MVIIGSEHPKELLRVTLDTAITVRGTLKRTGGSALILTAWRRQKAYIVVTCRSAVNELLRVLAYPRIRKKYGIQPSEAHNVAKFFCKRAERNNRIEDKLSIFTPKLKDMYDKPFIRIHYDK